MTIEVQKTPAVFWTPEVQALFTSYIDLVDTEVSGLGVVVRKGMSFLITSLILPGQLVSGASTDIDRDWIANFMFELISRGESLETIKLWWHSHVDFGCSWSPTDTNTMSEFKNGWMISLVGNKRGDRLCRVDFYDLPEIGTVSFDNVPIRLYLPEGTELEAQVLEEVAEKVGIKPPPPVRDEDEDDDDEIGEGLTVISGGKCYQLPPGAKVVNLKRGRRHGRG